MVSTLLALSALLGVFAPVDPTPQLPGAQRRASIQVHAPPAPVAPRDFDCESWRPLLEHFGLPYDRLRPIMWRESRCSQAHNYNPRTRDDSYGPFQVNIYGSLSRAWADAGFPREYLATPYGAVHAAALLYHACGTGPWVRPYGCPGGWPL